MTQITIINILLFIFVTLFPIISFIIPAYNLKAQNTISRKNYIYIRSFILILILILLGINAALYYILLFILPEYLYLKMKKSSISTFEKISLISLIMVSFFYVFYQTNLEMFNRVFDEIQSIYFKTFEIDKNILVNAINYVKDRIIYMAYVFFYITAFMIYFLFERKYIKKWFLNYYLLIIFVFCQILITLNVTQSIVVINLLLIVKFIYTIFGIKELFFLLEKNIKFKFFRYMIILFLYFYLQEVVFIIGGFRSFKIKLKKRDS